jgi:dipeptide/tripeptide permease
MAIAAVGNNLITYVFNEMHFPLSESANIVTDFIGTIFLLSLLGGFLSDSYLGSFWTMLIFGFVELSVINHFSFSLLSSLLLYFSFVIVISGILEEKDRIEHIAVCRFLKSAQPFLLDYTF